MPNSEELIPQPTGDGSYTFISQEFGEAFHSHYGAKQESLLKFVVPTQLANLAHKPILRILDVCYGLGYNTASALQTIWDVNPGCQVEVMALEINPAVPQAAIAQEIFASWDDQYINILSQLAFKHQVETRSLKAKLIMDDGRKSIQIVNRIRFLSGCYFSRPLFSTTMSPTVDNRIYPTSCSMFTSRWIASDLFLCCCCPHCFISSFISYRFYSSSG